MEGDRNDEIGIEFGRKKFISTNEALSRVRLPTLGEDSLSIKMNETKSRSRRSGYGYF